MRKGLIVSIQGYGTQATEEMAEQAVNGGAVAIRTDKRVKSNVPLIGLFKKKIKDKKYNPYITPTVAEVEIVSKWAEYVAIDCRKINQNLVDINHYCLKNNIKVVADIKDFIDFKYLKDIGFTYEYITTTFSVFDSKEPDINLAEMLIHEGVNVIAEGNYTDPEEVERVMRAGASNVCIGGAITGIYKLTKRFSNVCVCG